MPKNKMETYFTLLFKKIFEQNFLCFILFLDKDCLLTLIFNL